MSEKIVYISPYVFAGIRVNDLPPNIRLLLKRKGKAYSESIITDAIYKITNVPFSKIADKTRKGDVSEARKMYCYNTRVRLGMGLVEIGKTIGNRDHTTVIHNIKSYNNLYLTDENFRNCANKIADEIELNSYILI